MTSPTFQSLQIEDPQTTKLIRGANCRKQDLDCPIAKASRDARRKLR